LKEKKARKKRSKVEARPLNEESKASKQEEEAH
jgi:hypothetical protein